MHTVHDCKIKKKFPEACASSSTSQQEHGSTSHSQSSVDNAHQALFDLATPTEAAAGSLAEITSEQLQPMENLIKGSELNLYIDGLLSPELISDTASKFQVCPQMRRKRINFDDGMSSEEDFVVKKEQQIDATKILRADQPGPSLLAKAQTAMNIQAARSSNEHSKENYITIQHLDLLVKEKEDLTGNVTLAEANVEEKMNTSLIRTHTGRMQFNCDMCDKKFRYRCYLNMHMRTHTGERPFACDICHKKFRLKDNLIMHIRTHTGERPFGCDNCDKKFKSRSNSNQHRRTHTEERPFGCDICDKKFKSIDKLNRHKRTHTIERPFGCDNCDKKFKSNSNLKVHKITHTEERPFGCDMCDKKFKSRDKLNRHKKTHTIERPFGCDNCDKKFKSRCNLNQHIRKAICLQHV